MKEQTYDSARSGVWIAVIIFFAVWLGLQPLALYAQDASVTTSAEASVSATTSKQNFLERFRAERASLKEKAVELKENRVEAVQAIKARVTEVSSSTLNRRVAVQERFEARIAETIRKHTILMVARYNAAVARLDKIGTRIDSRIGKLKERGVTLTTAESLRTMSKEKGVAAKTAAVNLKAAIDAEIASSTPGTPGQALQRIRSAVAATETAIKAYHKSLTDTVRAIESAEKSSGTSATSTTSVQAN